MLRLHQLFCHTISIVSKLHKLYHTLLIFAKRIPLSATWMTILNLAMPILTGLSETIPPAKLILWQNGPRQLLINSNLINKIFLISSLIKIPTTATKELEKTGNTVPPLESTVHQLHLLMALKWHLLHGLQMIGKLYISSLQLLSKNHI